MSRDTQRQKVYDWENSQSWMIKKSYLTQGECHAVIKRLNKIYRKKVKLRFKNGHGSCWAFNQNDILIRNDWGRSYGVLLHEFAHCLSNDSHNGTFVSNYCLLLHYLHPEQPSIKDLVKSLNNANVDFIDFEKTLSRKILSKRLKPFTQVCTEPLPVPVKNVKTRVSAKQRVQKILDSWLHTNQPMTANYYDVAVYEYSGSKFVNVNGMEHSDVLDSWLEVEVCLLEAIEQRLHEHEDYK
tara:strand:+ start:1821 stop:2540 length:720 start_codon:yes stop_codon:yes gene_type:complete